MSGARPPQPQGQVAAERRPLRIVFFVQANNMDRILEPLLRELLERGHLLRIVFEHRKRKLGVGAGALFEELEARYPNLSLELQPHRSDPWLRPATALRYAIDYLRYLAPEYETASALRERARLRSPAALRTALRLPLLRSPRGIALLDRLLRRLERAIPVPRAMRALLAERPVDLVAVTPLVGLGSEQGDWLRAAEELGLPRALVVASWDNLSNKGVIKDVPEVSLVWNETQVEEAVRLHGLPRERVAAVGAHSFDHWFSWSPSTSSEEFATNLGLRPCPLVLYVCSSTFIARDEVAFLGDWLARIRSDPALGDIGVVLRPHPQRSGFSDDASHLEEPGRTVIWPKGGASVTDVAKKAEYYDSLYHSFAVVGINTSAMIEAGILRRPVFTVLDPRFRETQEGTLHFAYLEGGLLTTGGDMDEHLAQLAAALADRSGAEERVGRFVESFVRPHGIDLPATPRAVDVLEQAAADGPRAREGAGRGARALARIAPTVETLHARVVGPRALSPTERRRRAKWRRRRVRRIRRLALRHSRRAAVLAVGGLRRAFGSPAADRRASSNGGPPAGEPVPVREERDTVA